MTTASASSAPATLTFRTCDFKMSHMLTHARSLLTNQAAGATITLFAYGPPHSSAPLIMVTLRVDKSWEITETWEVIPKNVSMIGPESKDAQQQGKEELNVPLDNPPSLF